MKVRSVQFCISCCAVHWNAAHFCCTAVHCVVQWNAHSSRVQQRDGGASLANMVKNYMSTGFFGRGQASGQIYFQTTLAACICPICKLYLSKLPIEEHVQCIACKQSQNDASSNDWWIMLLPFIESSNFFFSYSRTQLILTTSLWPQSCNIGIGLPFLQRFFIFILFCQIPRNCFRLLKQEFFCHYL